MYICSKKVGSVYVTKWQHAMHHHIYQHGHVNKTITSQVFSSLLDSILDGMLHKMASAIPYLQLSSSSFPNFLSISFPSVSYYQLIGNIKKEKQYILNEQVSEAWQLTKMWLKCVSFASLVHFGKDSLFLWSTLNQTLDFCRTTHTTLQCMACFV